MLPKPRITTLPEPLLHVSATGNGVQEKSVKLLLLFSFQSVEIAESAFTFACSLQRLAAGSVAAVSVRGMELHAASDLLCGVEI